MEIFYRNSRNRKMWEKYECEDDCDPDWYDNKEITQKIVWMEEMDKRSFLLELLEAGSLHDEDLDGETNRTLVYVETNESAKQLDDLLYRKGFPVLSIGDDSSVREQDEALQRFNTGQTPIIVATSMGIVGMDYAFPSVKHVINLDLPRDIDEYDYRIGHTDRNLGLATSFFNEKDRDLAMELIKKLVEDNQEVPSWLESIFPCLCDMECTCEDNRD